jgi:hypothetical protein
VRGKLLCQLDSKGSLHHAVAESVENGFIRKQSHKCFYDVDKLILYVLPLFPKICSPSCDHGVIPKSPIQEVIDVTSDLLFMKYDDFHPCHIVVVYE